MSTSGVLRVLFRDNYSDSLTTPASVFGFLFIKKMCSKVGMLVKEKSKYYFHMSYFKMPEAFRKILMAHIE